ncbi:hypothetical protein LSH36_203g02027 [Paralvinella palmiformis]|uniref:Brix domain-containing protein n=1 Tax=Paralvinella palmiformis TaxID=53620 RepID=A0AAD9JRK0_9ANNE|nr:hypothetical protein LSH36_203g02027 [Paralvinella palmiformis]
MDEIAPYFNRQTTPKILITTADKISARTYKFCKELRKVIPNSDVFSRKNMDLKKIIPQAVSRDYTDLLVINEDRKTPNAILLCHLPDGPTAHFKLSNLRFAKEIKRSGQTTQHMPEVILNNFNTRLGHSVGRLLASLFPHDPEFQGRRLHLFRYKFRDNKKCGLQELGPRFTLKLRSLQKGTFDSKYGEYEWVHKRREMETSRRKFML